MFYYQIYYYYFAFCQWIFNLNLQLFSNRLPFSPPTSLRKEESTLALFNNTEETRLFSIIACLERRKPQFLRVLPARMNGKKRKNNYSCESSASDLILIRMTSVVIHLRPALTATFLFSFYFIFFYLFFPSVPRINVQAGKKKVDSIAGNESCLLERNFFFFFVFQIIRRKNKTATAKIDCVFHKYYISHRSVPEINLYRTRAGELRIVTNDEMRGPVTRKVEFIKISRHYRRTLIILENDELLFVVSQRKSFCQTHLFCLST